MLKRIYNHLDALTHVAFRLMPSMVVQFANVGRASAIVHSTGRIQVAHKERREFTLHRTQLLPLLIEHIPHT